MTLVFRNCLLVLFVVCCGLTAHAQLQFTEVLMNTLDGDERDWEWVEIRNTSGAPIDLDGYIFRDEANHSLMSTWNISAESSPTTVVPAHGVAVLYNASLDDSEDFSPGERFANAWELDSSVPLIAVDGGGQLNNGGDRIALWSSLSDYQADVEDPDMDGNYALVENPGNTVALLDFNTEDFLSPTGASIEWNGMGSNSDGTQWSESMPGVNHAVTSQQTNLSQAVVGVGSPGTLPGGTAPAELLVTEIMYDPAGAEPANEWIEVYNNTGADIDFGATPYVFYDQDGSGLSEANLVSGTIEDGTTAILHSSLVDETYMQEVWGATNNYIEVAGPFLTGTSGLANGGDQFALWSSPNDYAEDAEYGVFDNAEIIISYDDNPNDGWVSSDGQGSIYLVSLDLDPSEPSSWFISEEFDGFSIVATADQVDHEGGDVGSPGSFGDTVLLSADFDGDGDVDEGDLAQWQGDYGNNANSDADNDGDTDGLDFLAWQRQYTGPGGAIAMPEPTTGLLLLLAVLPMAVTRRRAN